MGYLEELEREYKEVEAENKKLKNEEAMEEKQLDVLKEKRLELKIRTFAMDEINNCTLKGICIRMGIELHPDSKE